MKKPFHVFSNKDTIAWFESRGVPLIIQDDLRVFPKSGTAQSIADCLENEAERAGVRIRTGMPVKSIKPADGRFIIEFEHSGLDKQVYDKVIVTTGGSPKRSGLDWLGSLGHKIEDPVPSLFSFNMPLESITGLMGISVDRVLVRIPGTKLEAEGPLLITHWGMSGPAILTLSSFGARILNQAGYSFRLQVNWAGEQNHEIIAKLLEDILKSHPNKTLANFRPFELPFRLWNFLLEKASLDQNRDWSGIGRKGMNRLVNVLTNDIYTVNGRTTFKDEFVTCGGVSLESVDMSTMQSKVCRNLYFAGEVLDIDAVTGGFNFQAAWTTGRIAGRLE